MYIKGVCESLLNERLGYIEDNCIIKDEIKRATKLRETSYLLLKIQHFAKLFRGS